MDGVGGAEEACGEVRLNPSIMMEMGLPVGDVRQAVREAGRRLVVQGEMSEETQKAVGRMLLPREMYIGMINEFFKKEMSASGG